MRRMVRTRFTLVNVLIGMALFAALGGAAYAASSSSFVGVHGNINACVSPGGGGLNVWKPGHQCSHGWVALAFPVKAQAGPSGPRGTPGATGRRGHPAQQTPPRRRSTVR